MPVGEGDLDFAVEFDRVPRASFRAYDFSRPEITQALQDKSTSRLSDSEDFQKEIKKIAKYVELKALKTVSLNEEKFLARRKELDSDKEDEEVIEKQMVPDNEIERTFYLDEVLRITTDYMDLLVGKS